MIQSWVEYKKNETTYFPTDIDLQNILSQLHEDNYHTHFTKYFIFTNRKVLKKYFSYTNLCRKHQISNSI